MTQQGSRFAERLLRLRTTLARQRRSEFEWLHNALVARLQSTTASSVFAWRWRRRDSVNGYAFDTKGNMRYRYWQDGDVATEYEWNEDNRLIAATEWYDPVGEHEYENGNVTEFRYDHEGRRIIKEAQHGILHVGETERTRYFFHGLTEDIKKVSVPGAHGDGAFEFVTKEDGASASEWGASGIVTTLAPASDSARRSDVIECATAAKRTFYIGDSASNLNANDTPWNATKRTLSFWHKGDAMGVEVFITSSAGEKKIIYDPGVGTDVLDGSGNAIIHLGMDFDTGIWARFERNIEADYESVSGGASWSNTDGIAFGMGAGTAHRFDDIRLSDSLTVEHNTLGPGMIGHILRHTTWDSGTLAKTDHWFHYDQVGSVMNETNDGGTLATTHHMDAFGNAQVSWDGGLWEHDALGIVFRSIHRDQDVLEMYSLDRWMMTALGLFFSASPHDYIHVNRYGLAAQNPNLSIGSVGPLASANDYAQAFLNCSQKEQRFCAPNYTDGCRTYANCMCGPGGRLQACMAAAGFPLDGSWTITQDMGTFHDVCTLRWNGLPICITHKLGILVPMWSCNGDYGQSQNDSESNSK